MDVPTSISGMMQNLSAFAIAAGSKLSERQLSALINAMAMPSPVAAFVAACEALYAARADLDDAGLAITAQLGAFCAQHGWPGGSERPGRIALAMRRDLGGMPPPGLAWPDPSDDPEAFELPPLPSPPIAHPQA